MRIDAAWGGVNNPRWRSLGQRGASPYAGGLAAACRRRAVVAKLLHGAVACLLLEATFRAEDYRAPDQWRPSDGARASGSVHRGGSAIRFLAAIPTEYGSACCAAV